MNHDNSDQCVLRRRYLSAFEIEGEGPFGIAVFDCGKEGWSGSTTFFPTRKSPNLRQNYFKAKEFLVFPILILSSNSFSILTLRQASFGRLRTGQDERVGKDVFPQTQRD
jgi:hypothetical protein